MSYITREYAIVYCNSVKGLKNICRAVYDLGCRRLFTENLKGFLRCVLLHTLLDLFLVGTQQSSKKNTTKLSLYYKKQLKALGLL